jgi:ribosomal protein S18 acetylase RimI-like enzyme
MIIRKAIESDLKSIQKLNNQLFDLEYNNFDNSIILGWPLSEEGREYFFNAINNNVGFVAEEDDKIIGYLVGSVSECSYVLEKRAELDNMCIDMEYRKLGVGTKLVDAFKEWCRSENIKSIIVVASKDNENAVNFYKKNLFEEYNIALKCDLGKKD